MITFMEQYKKQIEPRINAIDLFIKTETPPYDIKKTARLLQIPVRELRQIMKQEQLDTIDRNAFFHIMKNGTSPICRLFARELNCGLPSFYTAENISYIYNLDISTVLSAAKEMGVNHFSRSMVSILFQHIFVTQETQ